MIWRAHWLFTFIVMLYLGILYSSIVSARSILSPFSRLISKFKVTLSNSILLLVLLFGLCKDNIKKIFMHWFQASQNKVCLLDMLFLLEFFFITWFKRYFIQFSISMIYFINERNKTFIYASFDWSCDFSSNSMNVSIFKSPLKFWSFMKIIK